MFCESVFNHGDGVEALAFDIVSQRVAVSSHYGELKMLDLQGTNLVQIWNDKVDTFAIPWGLIFVDRGQSINIYMLENGIV